MPAPQPQIAHRLREGGLRKSPIREIMKLADPANLVAMGLDPAEVISFAGGWVNHAAPEGLQAEYARIANDSGLFHELGAYSPTRGLPRLREALVAVDRALYGTEGLSDEHILVGASSTQLTYSLFQALLDPGDRVALFDPSYANYGPQLDLGPAGLEVVRLPVFDTESWAYMPDGDEVVAGFRALLQESQPRLLLFSTPDNPTSQLIDDDIFFRLVEAAAEAGCWVVADFAYRAQCFVDDQPAHFAASPVTHPNLIRLHSNSKWCRGLGRRLGWIEAAPRVIEALEVAQQSIALCPDTVHQYALAAYLEGALGDGSLQRYLQEANRLYARAGEHTVACIREHLGMRCLDPQGGLYTVVDVERDGDAFTREVLRETGVIFVPGSGFGPSLTQALRVSYGPLVHDLDRIEEGVRRVGAYLRR